MKDGVVIYRSEFERARDQFLWHDGGIAILTALLVGTNLVGVLYDKWCKWSELRRRKKELKNDNYYK